MMSPIEFHGRSGLASPGGRQRPQQVGRLLHGEGRADGAHVLLGADQVAFHRLELGDDGRHREHRLGDQPRRLERGDGGGLRGVRPAHGVGDPRAHLAVLDVDRVGAAVGLGTEQEVEVREVRRLAGDPPRPGHELHLRAGVAAEALEPAVGEHGHRVERTQVDLLVERAVRGGRCLRGMRRSCRQDGDRGEHGQRGPQERRDGSAALMHGRTP
jgi:hypothetical protein